MSSHNRVVAVLISATLISSLAAADEVMPTMPRRIESTQPDDTALQITSERQRELDAVEREIREKRKALEAGQPPATQETPAPQDSQVTVQRIPSKGASENGASGSLEDGLGALPSRAESRAQRAQNRSNFGNHPRASNFSPSVSGAGQGFALHSGGTPLQVFAVSKSNESELGLYNVLPTGSHVKARIVSGVEANAREPYPVLLQLDYAFTGPNRTRIDLSHCFMIAKARANMSTERVMMETESLSCVRDDGEHFKREAKGFVAGNDNTFGATGTYISKQGQVLLAAVLASIAKNAGQAIADAQKTTSVLGTDKAATAANVTGSKAAFVGGSALIDGGAMVAQWYLEQAKELLPSIGVGSGQDVFVVMLDSIKVPQIQVEE